jgi:hypothetical protein
MSFVYFVRKKALGRRRVFALCESKAFGWKMAAAQKQLPQN